MREHRLLICATIVAGLSRFVARAATVWEWDETLFCHALRHYDVAAHQPHPLGFPAYIALAKFFRLFTSSDFRALQDVNLFAGFLVVPVTYLVARAFGIDRLQATMTGVVMAFLPNIWFYGGTGLSDVPAVVAVLGAVALLLNGRHSRSAWWWGCVMLGVSVAFRPQNALMGVFPWTTTVWALLRDTSRSRAQRFATVCGGTILALAIGCGAYVGAALASASWHDYLSAAREQSQWVMKNDSYHNPVRPHWWRMFIIYFLVPSYAGKPAMALSALGAVALLRLRRSTLGVLLTFGPFLVFAVFMLGFEGASRLSIGVMPLVALLSTEGAFQIGRWLERWGVRAVQLVPVAILLAIMLRLVVWVWPALHVVRTTASPTYAAMQWIRTHLDRKQTTLYAHGSMWPFVRYFLSDYRIVWIPDDWTPLSVADRRNGWLVQAEPGHGEGIHFRRTRDRIWNLSSMRYFEVFVGPIENRATFERGWYPEEINNEGETWRWAAGESQLELPGLAGDADLTLHLGMLDLPKQTVTIALDGQPIESFETTTPRVDRHYRVHSRSDRDQVMISVKPVGSVDGRDIGLELFGYDWKRAQAH